MELVQAVEKLSLMSRETDGARYCIEHNRRGMYKVRFKEVKYMNEGLQYKTTLVEALEDAILKLFQKRMIYMDRFTVHNIISDNGIYTYNTFSTVYNSLSMNYVNNVSRTVVLTSGTTSASPLYIETMVGREANETTSVDNN